MSMPQKFARLHHVGVVVQDLAASLAWYSEYLGFEFEYEFSLPGIEAAMVKHGDTKIEFFEVANASPMVKSREEIETNLRHGGINHFALMVDDIDATILSLKEKGVEVVAGPMKVPNDSGDRYAYIRDNEAMLIELMQPNMR